MHALEIVFGFMLLIICILLCWVLRPLDLLVWSRKKLITWPCKATRPQHPVFKFSFSSMPQIHSSRFELQQYHQYNPGHFMQELNKQCRKSSKRCAPRAKDATTQRTIIIWRSVLTSLEVRNSLSQSQWALQCALCTVLCASRAGDFLQECHLRKFDACLYSNTACPCRPNNSDEL